MPKESKKVSLYFYAVKGLSKLQTLNENAVGSLEIDKTEYVTTDPIKITLQLGSSYEYKNAKLELSLYNLLTREPVKPILSDIIELTPESVVNKEWKIKLIDLGVEGIETGKYCINAKVLDGDRNTIIELNSPEMLLKVIPPHPIINLTNLIIIIVIVTATIVSTVCYLRKHLKIAKKSEATKLNP
jgi:hypothetical protein